MYRIHDFLIRIKIKDLLSICVHLYIKVIRSFIILFHGTIWFSISSLCIRNETKNTSYRILVKLVKVCTCYVSLCNIVVEFISIESNR